MLQKDAKINKQTVTFISNWIRTGPDEKRKAFFDVWEIVLKNFLPRTRPILFRACTRISKNGKIASFTGRLECARRFSKGKGFLIICDTNEILKFEEELFKPGEYQHTFYCISSVLEKAKKSGGCGFSERFLSDYVGEDEYIMRVDLDNMQSFKWIQNE
ncbi:hypothetical protein GYM62_18460 [Algoriphagus sp. NBT04N3]|nr:hypothetical protein GYM62_18460 [Algoriphagus sp. NBT04N3]